MTEAPFLAADPEALLEPFRASEKPRERHVVGTEWERPGVFTGTFEPVPYEGPRGVGTILEQLATRHGWVAESETKSGPTLALKRDRASITLEPAAQLELSGAPLRTIHETVDELTTHLAEVDALSAPLGIEWLGLGFHPFASHAELPWVPKLRYGVMREYLPRRSPTGLDMMRRTNTVQANLDYADEEDAMTKLVTAMRLQPITTAMFANSPWVEGRATGEASHRAFVWIHMDPDRSGLLPFLWNETPSYQRYVEWALDVPMFIVKRKERMLPATHLTFRRFLREGLDGERATPADWDTHLNTLFPEVRLKRTLEMRGIDGQDRTLVPAVPALFKGLLYDPTSLREAASLASRIPLDEALRARPIIAEGGLRGRLAGRELVRWAEELLDLARQGLARIGDRDAEGRDETQYLEPLAALVAAGETPADRRRRAVEGRSDFHAAVVEASRA